jgi:hypothetical protein
MTDFTQQQYQETLAAIASGAVTECMEPYRETDCGMFRTLHNAGYVDGTLVGSLNRFALVDMALTPSGHSCLAAFSGATND